MFDLSGTGSRFLVALFLVNCSSNDPSKSEGEADGSDSGTSSSTSGMGAGNVSTTSGATTSPSTTNASGASTTSVVTGGDGSGGAGGTTNSSDSGGSQSTTRGQGFGFGDVGAGGSGGSGDSGGTSGDGGATSDATTTTATTGGGDCTPAVECEPEPLPSTGDVHQDCVDRVNQFRVGCWCMPALERWTEGEACADEHAQYDSENPDPPHGGFRAGICENGGNGQNECPGWGSETQVIEGCLQMMYDEGPPPSGQCEDQCFQEHGHFINMTNDNYTRVACGFYTTPGGDVWAVQNFR